MLINPLKSNGFVLISRTSPFPILGTFCFDFLSIFNKPFFKQTVKIVNRRLGYYMGYQPFQDVIKREKITPGGLMDGMMTKTQVRHKQSLRSLRRCCSLPTKTCPEVIKLASCSTQLSINFQLLIKTKMPKNKDFYFFQTVQCCIYHADKCLNANKCWHFNIYEQVKFRSQLR